jgi:predicted MFS family arabinose efflux permease
VAVLGMLSIYLLSRIDYRESSPPLIRRKFFDAVRDSAKKMFFIVRDNVPYRHFEIGFMLYGFAFMMTVTVIVLFFERALHLNYSSVAFYKNAYNLLAIILLPFFGRLLGKIDPRKFGIITFSSMLMYIFFLMMTEYFPYFTHFWEVKLYYSLIFYVVFHGVFAATMSLLWFIGSAYFCSKEEAGDYQSVHLFLTGFRAIFAPLIGVLFYELMGFSFTFSLAIICLLLAIFIMYWSYRREKRRQGSVL